MNEIFERIANKVKSAFPAYCVRVEEVPDSPCTCAIAVYGVAAGDAPAIKRLIDDLDWDLCQPAQLAALARVVSIESTRSYYPELLPTPSVSFADLVSAICRGLGAAPDIRVFSRLPSDCAAGVRRDDELALAA